MATPPSRVLPPADGPTGFFWRSGADGTLRVLRCASCAHLIHPPAPFCPRCEGREVEPAEVRGTGTVHTFTVNHQPWDGDPEPYVIAVVELDDQPGLRLTTNVVGVDPADVHVDMRVEVTFEDHHPVHLPLFRPATS